MNAKASTIVPEPGDPGKRAPRTHRKERTVPHRPRRRTQRLLAAYRERGDPEALDLICREHRYLVELFAKKYAGRGVDYDDLLQEANLGLLAAVERFDPSRGAAFSTYASHLVEGRIKQYFRDRAWPCSVPRRVKARALRIRDMERTLGRLPTRQEVADTGAMAVEEADEALMAAQAWSTFYLDQGVVPSSKSGNLRALSYVDPAFDRSLGRIDVTAAMQQLEDDERAVAALYYLGHLSQKEVAQRTGMSPMRVSRLLRKATLHLGPDFPSAYAAL